MATRSVFMELIVALIVAFILAFISFFQMCLNDSSVHLLFL
jgi:hypothetical protein